MNKYVIFTVALLVIAGIVLAINYDKLSSKKASFMETPNDFTRITIQSRYDPDGSKINLENLNNILNLDVETARERYQAADNPEWTLDVSYLNPGIEGYIPVGYDTNSYQTIDPKTTFCNVFKQEWANKNPQIQDVELDNMMKTSQAFNCDWNDFKRLYCSQKAPVEGVTQYGCDPTNYPGACKSLIQSYNMLSPQEKLEQFNKYKHNSQILNCVPKAIDKVFCRSLDVKDGVMNYGCDPNWYI